MTSREDPTTAPNKPAERPDSPTAPEAPLAPPDRQPTTPEPTPVTVPDIRREKTYPRRVVEMRRAVLRGLGDIGRDNPLGLALGAVAAGFLIGTALPLESPSPARREQEAGTVTATPGAPDPGALREKQTVEQVAAPGLARTPSPAAERAPHGSV